MTLDVLTSPTIESFTKENCYPILEQAKELMAINLALKPVFFLFSVEGKIALLPVPPTLESPSVRPELYKTIQESLAEIESVNKCLAVLSVFNEQESSMLELYCEMRNGSWLGLQQYHINEENKIIWSKLKETFNPGTIQIFTEKKEETN